MPYRTGLAQQPCESGQGPVSGTGGASAQPGTRSRFLWPGVLSRDLTQFRGCVCAVLTLGYNPHDKKRISVLKGTVQWLLSTLTVLGKHQRV